MKTITAHKNKITKLSPALLVPFSEGEIWLTQRSLKYVLIIRKINEKTALIVPISKKSEFSRHSMALETTTGNKITADFKILKMTDKRDLYGKTAAIHANDLKRVHAKIARMMYGEL